jgi:hypothetical protein
MSDHPYNMPFTRATYNKGCRCPDCKQANSDYMKRHRKNPKSSVVFHSKAQGIAATQAAAWVRANHPDVWDQLLREAKRRVRAAESI